MMNKKVSIVAILALPILMGACGSSKKILKETGLNTSVELNNVTENNTPEATVNYVQKVCANASTAKNIVSKIDFNLKTGSKDITVDGKISMRRDEVIRIQLSPMGLVEVGRMEFTPDDVLIMDRIHKQYVKVGYNEVSFLRNNGINFNSLQALFWNQLFVPGTASIQEKDMRKFEKIDGNISIEDGKMKYEWNVDLATAYIQSARVVYNGSSGKSSLSWQYGNFKKFQTTQFPTEHSVKFTISNGKEMNVNVSMGGLKDDNGWDAETKVPAKYKAVAFQDVVNQIMKMQ